MLPSIKEPTDCMGRRKGATHWGFFGKAKMDRDKQKKFNSHRSGQTDEATANLDDRLRRAYEIIMMLSEYSAAAQVFCRVRPAE